MIGVSHNLNPAVRFHGIDKLMNYINELLSFLMRASGVKDFSAGADSHTKTVIHPSEKILSCTAVERLLRR